MKTSSLLLLLVVFFSTGRAAIVDTITTYSGVMKKEIRAVVIQPSDKGRGRALPVVYLLHGYGDNYAGWVAKAGGFTRAADDYGMIIVCPDGDRSWYWDSPVDSAFRYETYITRELVPHIDKKYKTIAKREGRAITGLSMGGHGALYLSFRHQDLFGAAGSMSGGVDIRPFPMNWDMAKRLGNYAENRERWEQHTVINMLHLLTPGFLALCIDCGTSDFFYEVNENLHREMLYRNISHDYIVRPGAHTWEYWTNAVLYQLLFMHNYFKKNASADSH